MTKLKALTRKQLRAFIAILVAVCVVVPGLTLGIHVLAADPYSTPGKKKVNGLVTNKTVQDNQNGSYDVTLEAWADSDHIEQPPTDTVLVLDTSFRMTKTLYERTNYRNLNTHTILEPQSLSSTKHIELYDNDNIQNGDRWSDSGKTYTHNKYVVDPNCPNNFVYLAQEFYKEPNYEQTFFGPVQIGSYYHYIYRFTDTYGNHYEAQTQFYTLLGAQDRIQNVGTLNFELVEHVSDPEIELQYPENTVYPVTEFYSRPDANTKWYATEFDETSTVETLLSKIENGEHHLFIKDNNGEYREVTITPATPISITDAKTGTTQDYIPYYTFTCEFTDFDGAHKYETILGNYEFGAEYSLFRGFKVYKQNNNGDWVTDFSESLASKSLYIDILDGEDAEVVTKLQALKEAVEDYILTVHISAVTNGTDEHLGIVKYSRQNPSGIGSWVNGTKYTELAYSLDDVDMKKDLEVMRMIDTVYAYQATTASNLSDYANLESRIDLGMELAYNELNGNSRHTGHMKNCVVFTAGVPAFNGTRYRINWGILHLLPYTVRPDHYDTIVADDAISWSKQMKDNLNANVYTVGLFENANEDQLYGETFYYSNITYNVPFIGEMPFKDVHIEGNVGDKWGITDMARALTAWSGREVDPIDAAAINRMLNYISSDYSESDNVGLTRGTYSYHYGILGNGSGYRIDENFPRDDYGYYFAIPVATEEDDANEFANTINERMSTVFKTVAASTTTPAIVLDKNATLHDVITEYFKVKPGTTIQAYSESLNSPFTTYDDVELLETESDNIIDATNFDYMGHYTESDDPRKVVVKFTIVPQDDFLGGNVVPTNTKSAGIYDASGSIEENFDVPNVDVEPKSVGYAENQSIYYNDVADILDLIKTETVNGINNKFVNVTYTIKDEEGNTINTCLVPAGTAEMVWSNGDRYAEDDTTFSNENINHPRLQTSTKYRVETTVEPIYNRTYNTQTNSEDAYVYVFKPVVTQRDNELTKPRTEDITPVPMEDATEDTYNYYAWLCEESSEDHQIDLPEADPPKLVFTIKVGEQEVKSDENGLFQYYVDKTTDFTITNVEVRNLPYYYNYEKVVVVKDESGNVQKDDHNNPITTIEEDEKVIPAAIANLTPNDKILANNTKSIFYNKTKESDSGIFTISVGPQTYTMNITKTFQGDYAVSENVMFVFAPTDGSAAVEKFIDFSGTELTKTGSVTLTLGKVYNVTEEFATTNANDTLKDQQYRTCFTTEDGIVVTARTDAQAEGTESVTGESITFSYDGEPDDVVTLSVLNKDIAPPPTVTGISENTHSSNILLLALAASAVISAGGYGVYRVYRPRKE